MISRIFHIFRCPTVFIILSAVSLVACQTSPRKLATFSEEQIAALQGVGFEKNTEAWSLNLLGGKILFATGADRLTAADRAEIKKVANTLRSVGIDRMRIEGHADNIGDEASNLPLSERRAEAVAREMAANGIPYENIQKIGLGSLHPIANNQTHAGRLQNRRATIIVTAE